MKIQFAWRYFVIGFYVDRNKKILRIYPLPFVRISFNENK